MKYNGFQITSWCRTISHDLKLLLYWCLEKCNGGGNRSGSKHIGLACFVDEEVP